jgi:hypothetical protein
MANTIVASGPPYGPPANIKTILEFWRNRNMPEQVSKEWLTRIGLSPNLTSQNLLALRYLNLIDENGYTTSVAERLRVARSDEYQTVLQEIIRTAYAKIFEFTDPSKDSKTRITDQFRQEQPSAQRPRMVTCFIGLCAMAGIQLKESPPTRSETQPRVGQKVIRKTKSSDSQNVTQSTLSATTTHSVQPALPPPKARRLPDVIQGWIDRMPAEGETWNRLDYEKWLKMFSGSIEVLYKIEDPSHK